MTEVEVLKEILRREREVKYSLEVVIAALRTALKEIAEHQHLGLLHADCAAAVPGDGRSGCECRRKFLDFPAGVCHAQTFGKGSLAAHPIRDWGRE